MLRVFAAFLVVFSVLCLMVHLGGVGSMLALGALSLFALDVIFTQFAKSSRPTKVSGDPLL